MKLSKIALNAFIGVLVAFLSASGVVLAQGVSLDQKPPQKVVKFVASPKPSPTVKPAPSSVQKSANVSVKMTPDEVHPGQRVVASIAVVNTGNVTIEGASIFARVADGLKYVDGSANGELLESTTPIVNSHGALVWKFKPIKAGRQANVWFSLVPQAGVTGTRCVVGLLDPTGLGHPSDKACVSVVAKPTPTPSPEPSPSPVPSPSPSPSPAPSPSPVPSPSPKPTPTPSPKPSVSPSPSPKPSPSPTPVASPSPTPVASPSPTPAVGGQEQHQSQDQDQSQNQEQNNDQTTNVDVNNENNNNNSNENNININVEGGTNVEATTSGKVPVEQPETGLPMAASAVMFGGAPVGLWVKRRLGKGVIDLGSQVSEASFVSEIFKSRLSDKV